MRLSVSIVSHRQAEHVKRLITSMVRYESETDLEILLTRNVYSSAVGQDPVGTPFGITVLQNDKPRGFSTNHNSAFRYARGAYYCVLNPDVQLVEPVFDDLIQRIEAGRAEVVAPLVVDEANHPQDSFRNVPSPLEIIVRWLRRESMLSQEVHFGEAIFPEWVSGSFILMRAASFADLGGFDERYQMYFEDVDFCCRARLSGMRIMVDLGQKVVHQAQRGSRNRPTHLLAHMRSALRFFASDAYRRALELRAQEGGHNRRMSGN